MYFKITTFLYGLGSPWTSAEYVTACADDTLSMGRFIILPQDQVNLLAQVLSIEFCLYLFMCANTLSFEKYNISIKTEPSLETSRGFININSDY